MEDVSSLFSLCLSLSTLWEAKNGRNKYGDTKERPQSMNTALSRHQINLYTPCAISADDKLLIFFLYPRKQDLTFHACCLHWRKFAWISTEYLFDLLVIQSILDGSNADGRLPWLIRTCF